MPADLIQDALWHALYELGNQVEWSTKTPTVAAKLIEMKIAERHTDGSLALTPYGERCFIVLESGDGSVPGFNDYPLSGV